MKKIFKLFAIVLTSLFIVTGCGEKNVEGSLEEIMTKLYANIKEDERPMLQNINVSTDLKDDVEGIKSFIGTNEIEYEEILASEPLMGSIAHSVVLIRMKEGSDIEAAKTKILETVNPRKWVCVGVEKEDVIVKSIGDLIVLIIVENETTRTAIDTAFEAL